MLDEVEGEITDVDVIDDEIEAERIDVQLLLVEVEDDDELKDEVDENEDDD